LGLQSPKNLYIIPKGLNTSVKQRVENYVADNPGNKKQIKIIDDYFKTNKISYWNRDLKKYGGHTPIDTGTGLGQIGIEDKQSLKKILTGTYINLKGEKKYIADNPDKLIESVNEINKSRVGKDYVGSKTDFIGVNSGFNTDLLMKDPLVQKLLNSKSGQAVAKTLRGTTGALGKVFGGVDVILGVVDYENNISKGQSEKEALQNAFQAMSINMYKGGDRARTEEVKKFFVKNGGDGKIFDQVTALNTKDQEINDLIYKSKSTADKASINLSQPQATLGKSLNQRKEDYGILKNQLNKKIASAIEDRDGLARSYKTNLQVSEAGAPISIGNKDFFSKPFQDTKRAAFDKIKSDNAKSYDMQKRQLNFTSGNAGNFLQNNIFTMDPIEKSKQQKLINEMDERELYKFNLQRGMDPDNLVRAEDVLRYSSTSPDVMGVNTTKYVNRSDKAQGGIMSLNGKK